MNTCSFPTEILGFPRNIQILVAARAGTGLVGVIKRRFIREAMFLPIRSNLTGNKCFDVVLKTSVCSEANLVPLRLYVIIWEH